MKLQSIARMLQGRTLFAYIIMITLIMTLSPFRFKVHPDMHISVFSDIPDFINNLILFLPIGFLYFTANPGKRFRVIWQAFLFGTLFSAGIEMLQLLLEGRHTSVSDIVANAIGASLGALCARALSRSISNSPQQKLAELPLFNLILLLIPLFWLNRLGNAEPLNHILSIPLLGVIGGIVISGLSQYQIRERASLSPLKVALIAVGWFLLAAAPLAFQLPNMMPSMVGVVGGIVFIRCIFFLTEDGGERRIEAATLRLVLPLFTLYMVMTVYSPLQLIDSNWMVYLDISSLPHDPDIKNIATLLESIGIHTVLGYMIAAYTARVRSMDRYRALWMTFFMLSMAAEMEVVRAIAPGGDFSVLRFLFNSMAGMSGMVIYKEQVVVIHALRSSS